MKTYLPLPAGWEDEGTFVDSLLSFAADTEIFRNLCGGLHILDFLTREPDLYSTVLPLEWRQWFEQSPTQDILDFLLRQDLEVFTAHVVVPDYKSWRGLSRPPQSLLDYVKTVRGFLLDRTPRSNGHSRSFNVKPAPMPRHIAVGMKPKKAHEVENFASYVDKLTERLSDEFSQPINDIVDFGSGQNYLGRTLASPPYEKHVIAIERRHQNVEGARGMDVHARLAKKERKIMRNKKEWKKQLLEGTVTPQTLDEEVEVNDGLRDVVLDDIPAKLTTNSEVAKLLHNTGRITYIEHDIENGYLEHIINSSRQSKTLAIKDGNGTRNVPNGIHEDGLPAAQTLNPKRIVISLHSCGNLVHHGIKSLLLNPSVVAVAMIGCCYNLMTERLGPPTYKIPTLRPLHPRLESTSTAYDPHGFPMSHRLETFPHRLGTGIRLNITARMMAVQAPYNWGPLDSEAFFGRHFYRALLQRILLDVGVVDKPVDGEGIAGGTTPTTMTGGVSASGSPLIVGSLRKACFTSFHAYTRAALSRLSADPNYGALVASKTANLSDEALSRYEEEYAYHRKRLAVVWSLMAFSAGVVESIIAVDRWLYLREQDCVEECWVEPVFDYEQSPRNLVVVGIKKKMQ